MRSILARNMFRALIPKRRRIDPTKKILPCSKQHRRYRQVHLINQPRLQVLPNRRNASTESDIQPTGRLCRPSQRSLNPIGNKMEDSAAFHRDGLARILRQNEHRNMIRRTIAPPSLPALVQPRPTHRPKHIPSKNPRTQAGKPARRKSIIYARSAVALSSMHPLKSPRRKNPLMHRHPAHTHGISQVLIRPRTISID